MDQNLQSAFEALETYGVGGKRSALLPIDRAVIASLEKPDLRAELENHLTGIAAGQTQDAAKQYACGKLALIGSTRCVEALAPLLSNPRVATDARTALEVIPDDAAAKALMGALPTLQGLERAGVINSLAMRHYKPALPVIRRELTNPHQSIRKAAADAVRLLTA